MKLMCLLFPSLSFTKTALFWAAVSKFPVFTGQRIHFILWSPDCAPVKPRMIYSSSKDALGKKLEGTVATTVEAHELADLSMLN